MADPENKTEAVADHDDGMEDEDVEEINTEEGAGDGEGVDANTALIASQLMQSPEVLAALQGKLGGMIGINSGYIQSLPKVVKRRLKALKKLQYDMIKIESKFYEEVHELECKYAAKYAPLCERRKDIVGGGTEPTDSDCDWPSDEEEEDDEELAEQLGKAKIKEIDETKPDAEQDAEEEKKDESVTGVPEFWLTVFKNVDLLSDMIQEHDEPILKHLTDLKVKFSESNPMGFTLEFIFETNAYFSNTLLTKEYIMRSEPDAEEPFSFEGPEITKCQGCTIDWSKGKNVTVKVIKKTQKHKGRGTKRTVTKTVQNDSFFNFFTPPDVPEGEEGDDDSEALLAADFEIGHFIRERLVPRAVLYFTGEALEDDEFDDEEGEEEEGDEEEGDEEEDNDPDFNPAQVKAGGGNPGECKQQ